MKATPALRTDEDGNVFRVGIFLNFVRLATRTPYGVHRTCGEPKEIELAATGVELNGSRRVQRLLRARR